MIARCGQVSAAACRAESRQSITAPDHQAGPLDAGLAPTQAAEVAAGIALYEVAAVG
jgi:hypothetical protein